MDHLNTSILPFDPFKKELDCYEHRETMFSKMEQLWRTGRSCDLIIEVEGLEFYCHRICLVCISKYFSCVDKYIWSYSQNTQVIRLKLPHIDAISIDLVLEYIYTGHITANKDSLMSLIYTADYFLLDVMLESIAKILKQYLTINNVVDYYQLANQINHELLRSVTMRFIIRNVYKLHKEKKLMPLSSKVILNIIKDKRLIIRENSVLYFGSYFKTCLKEIINSWITHDFGNRKEFETILLDCLESQFLGSWFDKIKLETYKYIEPISRAYFLNSNPFGQHPPSLVCPPFNFRCLGRNIRRTFIDNPPHKWFIKKIIIYIIPDWNNVAAIADIQIDYKHYWSGEIQSFKAVIDNYLSYIKEEIELEDNERILKLDIFHGWMVYGIRFYTSNNRIFGLYGSSSGKSTKIDFQRGYSNSMYLHGFAFISMYSKEWHAINWLTVYGSMINKDTYYQDFQISFEADIKTDLDVEKEVEMSCEINETTKFEFEPDIYLLDINYPLPHTIEDLFYQWRRYMRIMRLSLIRRNNTILTPRESDSILPFSMSGFMSNNISSPEFIDRDLTR